MRLEGLGQLKNPMIFSGIETATFRLVAQCLNQLRYCVLPTINSVVTDLIKELPGNGSVNTSQHAIIQEKLCFLSGLPKQQ
jgi:hypothetical protein